MKRELPKQIDELCSAIHALPKFENESINSSFYGFVNKIDHIKEYYDVNKKYKIVFIGEPGKGKTTAICNWLNLLRKEKVGKSSIDSIPLLATASGRTTVAEVHIIQTEENSRIRIEYLPIKQQEEQIKEYCNYQFKRYKKIMSEVESEDELDEIQVHSEIDRVVRNMALLEEVKKDTSSGKQLLDETFMSQFVKEEDFYQYVLNRINLPKRQKTELLYTREMDFDDWLSSQFRNINDGKNFECSIAKRMYIEISKKDKELNIPCYVSEVIDTIGLDSTVRKDLQDLLLAKDTICFLVDELKAVPSVNVRNILKTTFLNILDEYCVDKTAIFVKSREEELAVVNEADGDIELGKEIKYNELNRHIEADKIPYKVENTLFLDACAAYIILSKKQKFLDKKTGQQKMKRINKIIEYDEDSANEYREAINNKIDQIVEALYQKLQEDAMEVRSKVMYLVENEKNILEVETTKELEKLYQKLLDRRTAFMPVFREEDIIQMVLQKAIKDIHWRTIRKMNSLYGGLDLWHTDIYHQIMQAGRELYSNEVNPKVNELKKELIDVRSEMLRKITAGYIEKLDYEVKRETEVIGKQFLLWAYEDRFSPQSSELRFWVEVNDISGKGYKNRVFSVYQLFIREEGPKLKNMMQESANKIIDDTMQNIYKCKLS